MSIEINLKVIVLITVLLVAMANSSPLAKNRIFSLKVPFGSTIRNLGGFRTEELISTFLQKT